MIPPIASDFVASEDAAGALDHVSAVNRRGVGGILNHLGEHYGDRVTADEDTGAYLALVDAIGRSSLDCSVSVKPSQIGLDVGEGVFRENLARVVERGADRGVFVWVDMEDHDTTDVTVDAFERHARESGDVGLCVQANLKRTPEDLNRLAPLPGKVRLVKGAYAPPKAIAYREKDRVDEAYRERIEQAFRQFDGEVAVGSHDPEMIQHAIDCHETYGTDFEIQMLMGVREDAQFDLAEEYEVNQYIPYGNRWLSYFYRRVRERKGNALFALRAVLD